MTRDELAQLAELKTDADAMVSISKRDLKDIIDRSSTCNHVCGIFINAAVGIGAWVIILILAGVIK